MGRRAYANIVNPVEVSIGIQRLLIGEYPQTWSPARIDLDAPPTGFYDLGAVVEDTPSLKVSREKYQLETGVPMVLQFEATQKVTGTFECQLHSNSWRKLQFGLGNYTAASSNTELGFGHQCQRCKCVYVCRYGHCFWNCCWANGCVCFGVQQA